MWVAGGTGEGVARGGFFLLLSAASVSGGSIDMVSAFARARALGAVASSVLALVVVSELSDQDPEISGRAEVEFF